MAGFPQNPGFVPDTSYLDFIYGMGNPSYQPRYGGDIVNSMRYTLDTRDSLNGWNTFLNELGADTPPSLNTALNTINAPNVTTEYNETISRDGGNAYEYSGGGNGNRGRGAGNGGQANSGYGGDPTGGFYNENGRFRDRRGGRDGIIGNGGGNRDPQRDGGRDMPGRLSAREIIDRIQARINGMGGGAGGAGGPNGNNYAQMARRMGLDTSNWASTPQSDKRDYLQQLRHLPAGVAGPNGRITYPYMPQPAQYYQQTGTTPPWRNSPYPGRGAGQPGTNGPSTQGYPAPQTKPIVIPPGGSVSSGNNNGVNPNFNPNSGSLYMGGNPNFNENSGSLYPGGMQGYTPPQPPRQNNPGSIRNNPYVARAQRMGIDTSGWANNGQAARRDFRQATGQQGNGPSSQYRQQLANRMG